MDAALHRSAEAESREPVIPISATEVGNSGWSDGAAPAVTPVHVSVEEGYERWAPTYDHAPNPLLNLEERKVTALLPDLSGKHVLDLACGTGRWLEKLLARGVGVGVGVDLSAAMLRVAAKKPAITGRLAQADCLALPFRSAIFDLVVCSFALGHIRDLGATVREVARVAKPGADVFVSDLHPEAYAQGWRTGFRDPSSAVQIEIFPRAAREIIQAFHSAGFECRTQAPLYVGESERTIFDRAGKTRLFATACQVPAILVCHFSLTPGRRGPGQRGERRLRFVGQSHHEEKPVPGCS
jgi:ubiquinone/menaquinone biosynthesis C-methylase UbiE